ncbi:MAG: hypothetical protein ACOC1O_04620 [bacterium]
MTENVLIYLVSMNVILFGLIYFQSKIIEKYRENLDEFASYLHDLQEELEEEKNDGRARTSDASK